MERALRTYQSTAYRVGQAEAAVGLGDILLQRGLLARAQDAFHDARRLAQELRNEQVIRLTILGTGDIARQRGLLFQARTLYTEALERTAGLVTPGSIIDQATLELRLADVATLTGELGEAEHSLHNAQQLIASQEPARSLLPQALLTSGLLLLTQGEFVEAKSRFGAARNQAEALQEPLLAARALLGLAKTCLACNELQEAHATFVEAGRQFQLLEYVAGDAQALLGVAETLISQQSWEEAAEDCQGALLRFQQVDDQGGRADAELAAGLTQRGHNACDEALKHFELALTLYRQQRQPLGEADALYERAGILLLRDEFTAALAEFSQATLLVERVMHTLGTSEQQKRFLQQYTELYAQKAIVLTRLNQESEACTALQDFTHLVGARGIETYLQTFEASIPIQGEDLTEEQLTANRALLKRLKLIRKQI
jgi:tetratricopeptide (TPR) repeat protein